MDCKESWERLLNASKISIFTHTKPDGDTLLSALALYIRLKRLGKKAYLFNVDSARLPLEFSFLPEIRQFKDKEVENSDVCVFVDCANIERVGITPKNIENAWILNIDHHASNTLFGDCNIVDSSLVASGAVMYSFLRKQGKLNKSEAEAIYGAILSDSAGFSTDRVDSGLFRICAELLEAGISSQKISDRITKNMPLAKMRLLNQLLSRITLHADAEIATSYILAEDFERFGGGCDMLEGFADYTIKLATVKMGIFAYEIAQNKFRVSLRSLAPYECRSIAERLGGGGHKYAAGYNSPHDKLETTLIEAINQCKERLHE